MLIHHPPFFIHHFASLGSTNDVLKSMTEAPEFTVVVADEQTAGRGRRDRVWHSAPGDGLYLSVLLRPSSPMSSLTLISLFSAIAVAETITELDVAAIDVKWPNDVLIGERKVCGILAEGTSSGTAEARVIVGIGVNLNHRHFPPELADLATSLFLVTGRAVDLASFRDRLLDNTAWWYHIWTDGGERRIVSRFEELSSYATGRPVKVAVDGEEIVGVTGGLEPNGALILHEPSGALRRLLAGEVNRLRGT